MRPLSQALKPGSLLPLAREAAWPIRKRWVKRSILAQIEERTPPVTFRNLPYYKPDTSTLSGTSRELLIAFADQVCEGRFPFLGYGTADLGRLPRWNVDFVSCLDWPQIPFENRHCISA